MDMIWSSASSWFNKQAYLLISRLALMLALNGTSGIPSLAEICLRNRFSKDNEPFKAAMQKFIEKIVSIMKAEKLFQTQGGPIILSQKERCDPSYYQRNRL